MVALKNFKNHCNKIQVNYDSQQSYISENLMSAQHEDYYLKNTCYYYKHACITLNRAQRGQAMKRLSWIKTGTFKSRMSILLNP